MTKSWMQRKKPARLEKRIEFKDYEQTREFLDQAAELAEKEGYYPDMSFGRTYVSITLYPQDTEEVNGFMINYANQMDELVDAARAVC